MTAKRTKRIWRRIWDGIRAVLFVAVIATLLLYAVAPDTAYTAFRVRPYVISYTASMEPMLSYYDMIFVKKCDISSIKQGDVVTFNARTLDGGSMVITHRVENVYVIDGKSYLRTKGIARDEADTLLVTEDGANGTNTLIGRFMFKSAALGRLCGFLTSKYAVLTYASMGGGLTLIYLITRKSKGIPSAENAFQDKDPTQTIGEVLFDPTSTI